MKKKYVPDRGYNNDGWVVRDDNGVVASFPSRVLARAHAKQLNEAAQKTEETANG